MDSNDKTIQKDKIIKKLHFKVPVAIRYSFVNALLIGIIWGLIARKRSPIFKSILIFTPITTIGLCYDELIQLYKL